MRIASLIALGCLCACEVPTPRGELVGAYHVAGALTENTCGSDALPAADPLSFDIEIRDEDGVGLWVRSSPPITEGKLQSDGAFSFTLQSAYDVPASRPQPAGEVIEEDIDKLADPNTYDTSRPAPPCRLLITESIVGTLLRDSRTPNDTGTSDAGMSSTDETAADLVAENVIAMSPAPGSNCARTLASAGGPFLGLPCRAHYDLQGTLAH